MTRKLVEIAVEQIRPNCIDEMIGDKSLLEEST